MYEGANHTHMAELLSECQGIDLGRTTLRRILVSAGLSSPRRRRPPKHRVRRQRVPQEGMLVQLDGGHHRWLGKDSQQFALLFAVDDATSAVVNTLFCEQEDSLSYFRLMQGLVQHRAVPVALYTDRHPVFKHRSEYQPAGTTTQFGRAMEELGIQRYSPFRPRLRDGWSGRRGPSIPAGHGTPAGRGGHHGGREGCIEAIPAPVQPAFPGPG